MLSCSAYAAPDPSLSSRDKIELPTKITWAWQISRYNNDTELIPEEGIRYTIRFNDNGSLQIQADCNQIEGRYELVDNGLSLSLGPATMAFCGESSLDQQFLQDLQAIAGWLIKNERLYLDIKYDTGTMEFSK